MDLMSLYGIVKDIVIGGWRLFQNYHDRQNKDEVEKKCRLLKEISEKGLVSKALLTYYSDNKLKKGDLFKYTFSSDGNNREAAMAIKEGWINLEINLNSTSNKFNLGEPIIYRFPKRFKPKADHAKQVHKEQNLKVWDAPIYKLIDVCFENGELNVCFTTDKFYGYRYSIGLLQDEILEALCSSNLSLENLNYYTDLPLRNDFLPDGKCFLDFRKRVCAGGISTIFAIAKNEEVGFVIPLQKRSSNVSDSQGLLSPIPRAFHQPTNETETNKKSQLPISETVYRELYEELFGGKEAEDVKDTRISPDWWKYESQEIQWLISHPEDCTFECICFGLDFLSGNYHFGILLVVNNSEFWNKFGTKLKSNWEADSIEMLSTMDYEQVKAYTIRDDWTEDLYVFIEALQRLQKIAPKRMNIPKIVRIL